MSQNSADQAEAKVRPMGPLLLILTALAAVVWVAGPTASGDEGRAAARPTAAISATR